MEGTEPVVRTESLDDGGEEEEQNTPGKTDPKREEYNHRFGQQHLCRTHKRDFEEFDNVCLFQLGFSVDGSPRFLAELLCALFQDNVTSGLLEYKVENGNQCGVVDDLDVEYPVLSAKLDVCTRLLTIARVVQDQHRACGSVQ